MGGFTANGGSATDAYFKTSYSAAVIVSFQYIAAEVCRSLTFFQYVADGISIETTGRIRRWDAQSTIVQYCFIGGWQKVFFQQVPGDGEQRRIILGKPLLYVFTERTRGLAQRCESRISASQ